MIDGSDDVLHKAGGPNSVFSSVHVLDRREGNAFFSNASAQSKRIETGRRDREIAASNSSAKTSLTNEGVPFGYSGTPGVMWT